VYGFVVAGIHVEECKTGVWQLTSWWLKQRDASQMVAVALVNIDAAMVHV
jgi:hypothetical protein